MLRNPNHCAHAGDRLLGEQSLPPQDLKRIRAVARNAELPLRNDSTGGIDRLSYARCTLSTAASCTIWSFKRFKSPATKVRIDRKHRSMLASFCINTSSVMEFLLHRGGRQLAIRGERSMICESMCREQIRRERILCDKAGATVRGFHSQQSWRRAQVHQIDRASSKSFQLPRNALASISWTPKSGEVQFGFLGEIGHVVIPLIRASKSAKVERMSSKLAGSERYMSRIAW